MTTLEILKEARRRLSRPRMWIRGWGAVPAGGDGQTCAVGAVRLAAGLPSRRGNIGDTKEVNDATAILASVIGGRTSSDVINYNDRHTQECVLTMFDAAIEREETKK